MARQSTTPISFPRTRRMDRGALRTSGRAGQMQIAAYMPLLRGDSAAGRFTGQFKLSHMPKPIMNRVMLNMQVWFVSHLCHPRFASANELMHSYQEKQIISLGEAPRNPPRYFNTYGPTERAIIKGSDHFKHLGLHDNQNTLNDELLDIYSLIYNFRLAAHSTKLARRQYFQENPAQAAKFSPAFWVENRFTRVVPDYDKDLVMGAMSLDVAAGQLPVKGIRRVGTGTVDGAANGLFNSTNAGNATTRIGNTTNWLEFDIRGATDAIYAEMMGTTIISTLRDIDTARQTQAYAKVRRALAGNNPSGYDADLVIMAELMQGFTPMTNLERPVLIDHKVVPFSLHERPATDGPNLEMSTSDGVAQVDLSINVPETDTGGMIMVTYEVVPERIYERQRDPYFNKTAPGDLPNALRDVLRPEPIDTVVNSRLDANHSTPAGLYGYEPMNDQWNREFTRLGGQFFSDTGTEWTEARSSLWLAGVSNPVYSRDHFLVPENMDHSVFSKTDGPAYEAAFQHDLLVTGITQFGDILAENNGEFAAIEEERT